MDEGSEDVRFGQTFRHSAKIEGERGVAEKTVPVSKLDRGRDGVLLDIRAGLLEAAEMFRLVGEERFFFQEDEELRPSLPITEVSHDLAERILFLFPLHHSLTFNIIG